MPVLDGNFEAFVTNLGKYNEGELVGEWVQFPTTEEELKKVFERIGIGSKDDFGHAYEEWFITDYECPVYGVSEMFGEYESLDKLNYLASLIEEMDKWDQEKFVAIMEAGCDEVSDIDDLINLTFNLDTYDFLPDVTDEEDLGRYYVEDAGIYDLRDMGVLANYIDYERFGRDVAMDEGGRFTDEGYIRSTGDSWDIQFDGSREDIPDEYRVTGSGTEIEEKEKMTVLVVQPGKAPFAKEIDTGLESLQHEVWGDIQAVYPFDDPVALICNEEGKMEGLALNRALRDDKGEIYDIVAGTFLVVGLTDDSFGSLTPELIEKFTDHFKTPEMFAKHGDKIVAVPMISEEQQKHQAAEQKDFEMNMDTSGLSVSGHIGTWHAIDHMEVEGQTFWLVEHDTLGDEAACLIVDNHGKLCLADVYDGFDNYAVSLLRQEVMPVDRMPDDTISIDEMKDYGYGWGGMLPMRQEAAAEIMKTCTVYCLYGDDSEGILLSADQLEAHALQGGIFGIEKTEWIAKLERENPLKAAEMSMEDDYGMIDGIINNGPKEDVSEDKGSKSSIMDRLKAAKSEPQQDKPTPHKEKSNDRDL